MQENLHNIGKHDKIKGSVTTSFYFAMKYIIHAHSSRMWYVDGYLVPKLKQQGINPVIYEDKGGEGNLYATMSSFIDAGDAWHLQDDVVICHDFAERTKDPETITCGFCRLRDSIPDRSGRRGVNEMWFSFPCIYIPGEIARECALWFYTEEITDIHLKRLKELRKGDDSFFMAFLWERYPNLEIVNVRPNLVDHIDYMIGGSIANQRALRMDIGSLAAFYEDDKEDLIRWLEREDLKRK